MREIAEAYIARTAAHAHTCKYSFRVSLRKLARDAALVDLSALGFAGRFACVDHAIARRVALHARAGGLSALARRRGNLENRIQQPWKGDQIGKTVGNGACWLLQFLRSDSSPRPG